MFSVRVIFLAACLGSVTPSMGVDWSEHWLIKLIEKTTASEMATTYRTVAFHLSSHEAAQNLRTGVSVEGAQELLFTVNEGDFDDHVVIVRGNLTQLDNLIELPEVTAVELEPEGKVYRPSPEEVSNLVNGYIAQELKATRVGPIVEAFDDFPYLSGLTFKAEVTVAPVAANCGSELVSAAEGRDTAYLFLRNRNGKWEISGALESEYAN